jgi:hypothetical protein
MRLSKKLAIAAVSTVAAVGVATSAFAFWSTTGSGSGSASATAGVSGQLGFSTSSINAMYPGDSAQAVTVTVTNNSSDNSKVQVASVKAYLTVSGSCAADDFKLDGNAAPGDATSAISLAWTNTELAHGASASTAGTDTIQFNDKGTNQDGCKSAAVTLHYLAS